MTQYYLINGPAGGRSIRHVQRAVTIGDVVLSLPSN